MTARATLPYSFLRGVAKDDPRYKAVAFFSNFGHQMAITEGIDRAERECVVVKDADL
jgi:hypothetical protein